MKYTHFLTNNARWLLGGFLLTFFSSFGQTFFISLSGGAIREEYGLSNGEWGTLYMVATLGSALTLPFLGRIVDHVSVSRTVLLIVPALAIAAVAMSFSQSLMLLLLVLYGLRLFGQGMMTHISLTAMGRWYSAQRGRAVSVAVVGHQAGEAILPVVFVYALLVTDWRGTWLAAAIFLLLGALPLIYLLMRVERSPSVHEVEQEARSTLRQWTRTEVVRDTLFWALLTAVLAPAVIGTTLFFHQDYLIELRSWDKLEYSLSFTVMAIMTFGCAIIAGITVDRFGAISHLPFFLLPLSAACFAMWAFESIYGSYLFMGLLGEGGEFRSLCVRKTDGYYFPISFQTRFRNLATDDAVCQSMCPGVDVGLYYHRMPGQDSEDMIAYGTQRPYAEEAFAFTYRSTLDKENACRFAVADAKVAVSDAVLNSRANPEEARKTIGTPVFKKDRTLSPDTYLNADLGIDVESATAYLDEARKPKQAAPQDRLAADDDRKIRIVGPAFFPVQ